MSDWLAPKTRAALDWLRDHPGEWTKEQVATGTGDPNVGSHLSMLAQNELVRRRKLGRRFLYRGGE